MSDAVAIMQSLANPNKYQLTAQGKLNADVYDAGSGITTNDAFVIQKYLLGLIKTLPESYSEDIGQSPVVTTNVVTNPVAVTTEPVTTAPSAGGSVNDTFDSGIGDWSGRGAASVAATDEAYYGSSGKSLLITDRTSEWNGAAINLGSDFKAGQTYSISLGALQLSGSSADIQISLQHSDGSTTSYTSIAKASCESGVWTKIENTSFTIPENAGDMVLYVEYALIEMKDDDIFSDFYNIFLLNLSVTLERLWKNDNINRLYRQQKALYEKQMELSVHDELTGILNRRGFNEFSQNAIKSLRGKNTVCTMVVDMDGLKHINDIYGHNEGDFAIRMAAHIITECCVSGEIAGRAGGDEFYIYASDYSQEKLDRFERELVRLCEEYNESNGKPYRIELSCGAYLCETDSSGSIEDYLKISDARMYEQKMSKPDRKKR